MDQVNSRSTIAARVAVAHFVGLWTTGMAGTIGTTSGFSIFGGGWGVYLGGLFSLPWVILLGVLIWYYYGWIAKHPFIFALVGPFLVCASYALFGISLFYEIAVSAVASSVCYILIVLWKDRRSEAAKHD